MSSVGRKGLTTLIGGGVVNAFGPTLHVIAADGYFPKAVGRLPILRIGLSPFSQSCHTVGYVDMGDVWDPLEDLEPFLATFAQGDPPTLLMPSRFMSHAVARALYARVLSMAEGGKLLQDSRAVDLAATLLRPDNIRAELATFIDAWDTWTKYQGDLGPASRVMSTESFIEMFCRLCATCDLPFLG